MLVLLVLNVGNGWVAGVITSDEVDHSRKCPTSNARTVRIRQLLSYPDFEGSSPCR
jgi:hypothetical protein